MNPYAYLDETGSFSASVNGENTKGPSIEKIAASRRLLQDPYAYLDEVGMYSAAGDPAHDESDRFRASGPQVGKKYESLVRKRTNRRYSMEEIEAKARELQVLMWQDRDKIWPGADLSDPIQILDPAIAASLIGYDFDLAETLGQYVINGKQIEVAGTIDNSSNEVRISRQFSYEVRNFTAAHELGHAFLHDATGLHRDRPLDGTAISRERVELEADKFASYFLMPGKLVKARFRALFGTDYFVLNEATSFALARGNALGLRNKSTSLRDLSKTLASAESYNGLRFVSLATQFRVSTEAMAIRLEELGLVG